MDEELSAELLERAARERVRDPAGLDERRAALGLEPEAANRARLLAAEGLTAEHRDDAPGGGG